MQGDRIVLRTLAVYTPDQVAEGELRLHSSCSVLQNCQSRKRSKFKVRVLTECRSLLHHHKVKHIIKLNYHKLGIICTIIHFPLTVLEGLRAENSEGELLKGEAGACNLRMSPTSLWDHVILSPTILFFWPESRTPPTPAYPPCPRSQFKKSSIDGVWSILS